jgi:hypothetical protein
VINLDYHISDLESYTRIIEEAARDFRLDCYPQEFEICNYITNIFLDGFFHQLPVTSPVFSAPVPALAIIITENGQMDHSPKFFCI